MSLAMQARPRGDLLDPDARSTRAQVELPRRCSTRPSSAALHDLGLEPPACRRSYESPAGPGGCARPSSGSAATPSPPCGAARRSSCSATGSREPGADSHVPPLLAVGAVHHRPARRGLRCRPRWSSDSAQCWSVHHFACLIGYGASAVLPVPRLRDRAPTCAADDPGAEISGGEWREPAVAAGQGRRQLPRRSRERGCSRSSPRSASRCWPATTARSSSRPSASAPT